MINQSDATSVMVPAKGPVPHSVPNSQGSLTVMETARLSRFVVLIGHPPAGHPRHSAVPQDLCRIKIGHGRSVTRPERPPSSAFPKNRSDFQTRVSPEMTDNFPTSRI